MDKKQFIDLLYKEDYNLILFEYALENGGKFKNFEIFEQHLNNTLNNLYSITKGFTFTYGDLVHKVVDYYKTKLNVVTIYNPSKNFLIYM